MIPRYGKPPLRRTYVQRPGIYAILPLSGGFLLTQQEDPGPEIQLPGGGIDAGEHPIQALYREVREETGWKITRPYRFGTFRQFTYMPEYKIWAEKICHIYAAHPVRPVSEPIEVGHTVLWLDVEGALSAVGSTGGRRMLLRYVERISGR